MQKCDLLEVKLKTIIILQLRHPLFCMFEQASNQLIIKKVCNSY